MRILVISVWGLASHTLKHTCCDSLNFTGVIQCQRTMVLSRTCIDSSDCFCAKANYTCTWCNAVATAMHREMTVPSLPVRGAEFQVPPAALILRQQMLPQSISMMQGCQGATAMGIWYVVACQCGFGCPEMPESAETVACRASLVTVHCQVEYCRDQR